MEWVSRGRFYIAGPFCFDAVLAGASIILTGKHSREESGFMSIPASEHTELQYLCGCSSSKMQLVMFRDLCKVDFYMHIMMTTTCSISKTAKNHKTVVENCKFYLLPHL